MAVLLTQLVGLSLLLSIRDVILIMAEYVVPHLVHQPPRKMRRNSMDKIQQARDEGGFDSPAGLHTSLG